MLFHTEPSRSYSLASMLNKATLSPSKLDEIKIKANVLKAFAADEAPEVDEKAESITGKATGEL